jgi:hypothetical protein
MDDEMLEMMLFHMGNNMKLELDNMYWNNKPLLLQYSVRLVMMMNMEYSLVYLEYKIMYDQMVKLMMMDMDQFLFENLKSSKREKKMCH